MSARAAATACPTRKRRWSTCRLFRRQLGDRCIRRRRLDQHQGRHTGGNVNIGLIQGEEKLRREWVVGGRVGWLFSPRLLSYVSGGYTRASFSDVNYVNAIFPAFGAPTGLQLPSRSHSGWFFGGGVEYALGWLPGLFWKNEYRFADYSTRTDAVLCNTAALCGPVGPTAFAERNHPFVQTVRSELVWRFSSGLF